MKTIIRGKVFDRLNLKGIILTLSSIIFTAAFVSAPAYTQTPNQCKTLQAEQIFAAETLLANLGYWIVKVDCSKDDSTRQAIIAFQKAERLKRTGVLTNKLLGVIQKAARPLPRYTGAAHVEIDITRQILFLVNQEGVVERVLSVSTGSEKRYFDEGKWQTAHTPRGTFAFERKISGVRRAPLGNLYNPNYFYGGVAIHGSNSVPIFPASHGCVRIPRFADAEFSRMVWIGMRVYVYD